MAREKFPSDEVDRLMLRFPAGMRDRLAEAAKANNRSMNAEIVSRLQQSLDGASRIVRGIPLTDEGLEALRSVAAETREMVEAFKDELTRAEEYLIAREKSDEARTRSNPKPD